MPGSRPTEIRWFILALILFASFVSFFVRSNLSVLADTMIDDLGLTPIQLGYVFSAFAAGYALFQLPGGMLGHRFGARSSRAGGVPVQATVSGRVDARGSGAAG